jgi:tetratricopeptide (TPR) repeat protein
MVHKNVKKHLEAGKRLFDLGDIGSALEEYKAALAIDPDCALVHFNLGFAFYESKDPDAARRCYQRSIELEPNCSLFLEHLAKLHFESEEYSQSISLFQRANAVGEIQPVSFGLWGRSFYELEQFDSAAEQLERMLRAKLTPTLRGYALYYLTLSRLKGEDLFPMRRDIIPLLDLEMPEYDLLADLGEQLLDGKCISLAKQCFERFLDKREDMTVSRSYQEIVEIEQRVDQILPRLFSGDEERILQNIHLLYQFGNEKVARALASIQDAQSPLIREAVVEYHLKYGYPYRGELSRLCRDEVAFVREKAFAYLYKAGEEESLALMREGLEDDSAAVRRFAVMFLRDKGAADHLPVLEEALGQEQDNENQRQLRLAMAAVKMRSEKKRKAMIEDPMPIQTPRELLLPVSPSSAFSGWKPWLGWGLLVAAISIVALFLLSL